MIHDMLGIMQKHVQEQKLKRVPGARLGLASIQTLKLGSRFYQAGQTWSVRFTPNGDPNVAAMVRKVDISSVAEVARDAATFDYRVLGFDDAGNARISVTQRVGANELRAEPRVDHVVLSVNRKFSPVRKEIFYRDGRAPLTIRYDSGAVTMMGFSAAPIDLPNLDNDDGSEIEDGGKKALQFEVMDLYARPVTTIWREGELWPALVKTTAGDAVLIK
jgi:hypothetical protein